MSSFIFLYFILFLNKVNAHYLSIGNINDIYFCRIKLNKQDLCESITDIHIHHEDWNCHHEFLKIKFKAHFFIEKNNSWHNVEVSSYIDNKKKMHEKQSETNECSVIRRF